MTRSAPVADPGTRARLRASLHPRNPLRILWEGPGPLEVSAFWPKMQTPRPVTGGAEEEVVHPGETWMFDSLYRVVTWTLKVVHILGPTGFPYYTPVEVTSHGATHCQNQSPWRSSAGGCASTTCRWA